MKAYRFDDFARLDALRLHDEADPRPQRGEVLVRVRAVSLNYRDLAMVRGRYPRAREEGVDPDERRRGRDRRGRRRRRGLQGRRPGDRGVSPPVVRRGRCTRRWAGESYGDQSDGWLVERKVVSQEAVVRFARCLSLRRGCRPCRARG